MTLRATRIPAKQAPLYYGLAGVLLALSALALVALLRMLPLLEVLKLSWAFLPVLLIIVLLVYKARRLPKAEQLVLLADQQGISLRGGAPLPWGEVAAVFLMEQDIGYGARAFFGVRKAFTPNRTEAKWAERKLHTLLSERSAALNDIGMDKDALMDAIDTELARAGLMRGEKSSRKRGANRQELWPLVPLASEKNPAP